METDARNDCKQASIEARLSMLAPREREITELALRNITSKDIASQLNVSPSTVRSTLHRVYQKLEVSGLRELSRLAAEDLERGSNGSADSDPQSNHGSTTEAERGVDGNGASQSSEKIGSLTVPYVLTLCGILPLLAMFLVGTSFDVRMGTLHEWFGKLSACFLGFLVAWWLDQRLAGMRPALPSKRLAVRVVLVSLIVLLVSAACWTYVFSFESNGNLSAGMLLLRCVAYCDFACLLTFGLFQLDRYRQLLRTSSAALIVACAFACLFLVILAGRAHASYFIVLECLAMSVVGILCMTLFQPSGSGASGIPRLSFTEVLEALKTHAGLAATCLVAGFMVTTQMSVRFDPIVLTCMTPYSITCFLGMVFCRRHGNWRWAVCVVLFGFASTMLAFPTRLGFAVSLALASFLACLFTFRRARFEGTCYSAMVVSTMLGACFGIVPSYLRGIVATLESGSFLSSELYALIAMIVLAVSIIGCMAVWSLVQECEIRSVGERGRVTLGHRSDAERMRSYLIAKGLGKLEVEVVMSSLKGRTAQEIASEVHYSPSTVKAIRRGAFAQLGISGVAELPTLFDQLNAL